MASWRQWFILCLSLSALAGTQMSPTVARTTEEPRPTVVHVLGRIRQAGGGTRHRRFEQLRASAGLDWLHLHDLRHAFATFLLDQGEELRTVMELLGHSTIRLTADTYGHVLPARARHAASAIDRILGEA